MDYMRNLKLLTSAVIATGLLVFQPPRAFGQTTLPSPWSSQDIGSPAIAGSSTLSSGVFIIEGSGSDIWGTSDQFRFVYQTMTGDGEVLARVDSVTAAHAWSKAGVMMRETLSKTSKHAYALSSAGKGVAFQRRVSTGGSSANTAGTLTAPPRWVRLVRKGSTFTAYESADGQTWRTIGSNSITMTATIYVGLAVTSHNSGRLTTARVSSVSLTPASVANQPPAVSLTAPANGATYVAPATIGLSASASDADGTISKVDFYNGSTLLGSDNASPYSYSWNSVTAGSYSLTAVATDNLGARTTSATTTVTVSDTSGGIPAPWSTKDVGNVIVPGSASETAGTFTVAGAGTDIWGSYDEFRFVYQQLTGDGELVARVSSLAPVNPWSKAGVMMRDNTADGSKHASVLISPGNGIAFQRRTAWAASSLNTYGAAVAAPYWARLVRRGNTFEAYESADGSSWKLIGTETIDMLQTIDVGLAVTSRDASTTTTAVFSSVSVTDGTTSNQAPTVTLTTPANGATYTAPANMTLSASASDPDGTISRVDFYRGSALIGSDTSSPYTVNWSNVSAGTYVLTAVATDNGGQTTTSNAANVTVSGGTNIPPSVTLTSPSNGSSYTAPATMTISASASDSDGTVARVDFYRGSTLIGSDTATPYSVSWSNVAGGTYSLTAVATDNSGATTTSGAVSIAVGSATNIAPAVSLTSPVGGSSFSAPAVVALVASATDSDGSVAKVDFYAGTTLVGTATASPYTVGWTNAAAGTYSITARATDNAGAVTTSAAVAVTLRPSQAVFTASVDQATVTSYRLDVFVAGADPLTATPVATTDLGKPTPVNGDITVDITSTLQPLAAGTYFATVTAINSGGSARSAPSANFTR